MALKKYTRVIGACEDCPFMTREFGVNRCQRAADKQILISVQKIPDWCPLEDFVSTDKE